MTITNHGLVTRRLLAGRPQEEVLLTPTLGPRPPTGLKIRERATLTREEDKTLKSSGEGRYRQEPQEYISRRLKTSGKVPGWRGTGTTPWHHLGLKLWQSCFDKLPTK